MIVIDPFKPKTDLIDKYNATYIEGGVTEIDYESYLKLLPSFIKKNYIYFFYILN